MVVGSAAHYHVSAEDDASGNSDPARRHQAKPCMTESPTRLISYLEAVCKSLLTPLYVVT